MKVNQYLKAKYDKLGPRIAEEFLNRHFEAYYVDSAENALKKALELINKNDVISWGGSETIKEIGLLDKLKSANYKVIDRNTAKSPEERIELMRQALLCDTYLMSCNAGTEDGQLVNIDGNGNRVAALAYGPKNVIVIAGMNKIAKTIDDAWSRARNIAAPANIQRFPQVITPCNHTGTCGDCISPDSICATMVTTRICRPAKRIKVILVGEDLGF